MSKAFTKEPEGSDVYDDLPDRPISPHNLVTPEGLETIEAELVRLHLEHTAAQDANDRALLAKINRDLRYWTSRRATAQVVEPPDDATEVHFGSTVTILREDGRRQTYRIVGEDEADPSAGTLSYVSPVAQALMGKQVGEMVEAGAGEAKIVRSPERRAESAQSADDWRAITRKGAENHRDNQVVVVVLVGFSSMSWPCFCTIAFALFASSASIQGSCTSSRTLCSPTSTMPVVVWPSRLALKSRWSPFQSSVSTTNFSPKERTSANPSSVGGRLPPW